MKTSKKIFSLLLALSVLISLFALNAAAADSGYTITVEDAKGTAANAFEAYQVFAGTLSEDETVLSNISWGSGVSLADGTLTIEGAAYTAQEAADALSAGTLDADVFAAAIAGHLSSTYVSGTAATAEGDAVLKVPAAGYYLVQNTEKSADEGEAYTRYILQVVRDVEVKAKTDAPSIIKKIKNSDESDQQYRDANNVAIGDTVNYRLTSAVPDMSAYSQYYFIVNDRLSSGLTYTPDSMQITLGGTPLTEGTDYFLTVSDRDATNGTAIQVVFHDFIQYKAQKDAAIVITYDAVLNESAKINEEGNPNYVTLTYSNNPNKVGTGKDQPGPGEEDITGVTPKDWTITYTTRLKIYKTDKTTGKPLSGAEFTLVGTKQNSTTTCTETYVKDDTYGTWYRLTDDTYTETAPTEKTAEQYASTTDRYVLKTVSNVNQESELVTKTVTTGTDGLADLGSLAAGTYRITEVKAPDGYNMLTAPIEIVITADSDGRTISTGDETVTWTVTQDGTGISRDTAIDATAYLVGILNSKGATLPATGGMGTTLFYALGGILFIGAGVLLVTRRRMQRS